MVNKKLKGTVEIELKSKQFQDEAKKVTSTLKGLETYVKQTDKVLRSLGGAWQTAYKAMNTFASVSAKIQKTNYNNLKSSTDATSKSTRDLGDAGNGTAKKIEGLNSSVNKLNSTITKQGKSIKDVTTQTQGLGSTSNTTAQKMGGLNTNTNKLNATLQKQQTTLKSTTQSTAQYGTTSEQTGKKAEKLSLFVNQSEKSMKVMTSHSCKD